MKRPPPVVISAFVFTAVMLVTGYLSFGVWTAFIFSFGFLGGFILWIVFPGSVPYSAVKWPYWLALAFFVALHKVEENILRFQEALSQITGTPVPDVTSISLILLLLLSVGGWLLVPLLMKRRYQFGNYLAWSFFASMGITELAHFVFPFFVAGPYGYFPGMASVIVLAPTAWWGMARLIRNRQRV